METPAKSFFEKKSLLIILMAVALFFLGYFYNSIRIKYSEVKESLRESQLQLSAAKSNLVKMRSILDSMQADIDRSNQAALKIQQERVVKAEEREMYLNSFQLRKDSLYRLVMMP